MDHDVAILSPEKAILTFRLAGLGARIAAHLLDVMIVLGLTIALNTGLASWISRFDGGLAFALAAVMSVFIPIVYFVLFEGLWNGQTLGKKAAGIRVRMIDGTPITFQAALGRNLLRPADMLPGPYLLGLLAIFSNPRAQRIGDLVAGTMVCYERRGRINYLAAPHHVGVHLYEEHVGELRGMTDEEYFALRRLADRFPELPAETQRRLMHEIWEPFAQRRGVPSALPNRDPMGVPPGSNQLYLLEAVVMKYGRMKGLL